MVVAPSAAKPMWHKEICPDIQISIPRDRKMIM